MDAKTVKGGETLTISRDITYSALTIKVGGKVVVDAGATLTIAKGGYLRVKGEMVCNGNVVNNGETVIG